jgi:hypothetical protein
MTGNGVFVFIKKKTEALEIAVTSPSSLANHLAYLSYLCASTEPNVKLV